VFFRSTLSVQKIVKYLLIYWNIHSLRRLIEVQYNTIVGYNLVVYLENVEKTFRSSCNQNNTYEFQRKNV
jgi:hypothetical protein